MSTQASFFWIRKGDDKLEKVSLSCIILLVWQFFFLKKQYRFAENANTVWERKVFVAFCWEISYTKSQKSLLQVKLMPMCLGFLL